MKKQNRTTIPTMMEILFSSRILKSMGHFNEEDCEKPIINQKGTVFVVKDYVDNNKELPCFKGIAFFNTTQINTPSSYGENYYVLDFVNCTKDFVDEDNVKTINFKSERFIFIDGEISNIRDKDKIIGNIEYSMGFTEVRKRKKIYIIKFNPTKEAVFTIKTEEIFDIMESFKEQFENKY